MGIDSLMPYLVNLVVFLASVGVIYLVYNFKSTATKNLPPGKKGLPYFGETLDYALAYRRGSPEKFIIDRTTKYSPDVFRTSLLGEEMAVFCGAEGNKFLFSGQNNYVISWWPKSLLKIMKGSSNMDETIIHEDVRKLRNNVIRFLRPDSLQHYIPVMDMMAKEHLDKYWTPNEQVQVFPLSQKYTSSLACRFFISIQDQETIEKFANLLSLVIAGIISMPINLPGTAFNRAVKANRQMRQEILALTKKKIELLEKGKTVGSDLLQSMLMDGITEEEVGVQIMSFFLAGHDTTRTVITFFVSYLSDYPDIYNKVLEEHMDILRSKEPGESLRWEDIQKMKYTWCVACEAMRLAPPANGLFKEAITDITYAGYTIPKGWKVFWTVDSTHKNPKYFPNPEKFDPSRFQGDGPTPYTFVPFGGGPRMCPGKEFARVLILSFIHNLVTKFKWEKLNPNEKISYIGASPFPEDGLPVKLQLLSIN